MPTVEVKAPAQVELALAAGGLGQDEPADQEDDEADRGVDEQHPAPGRPLGEHAAGHQADGCAADGHRR